jgi:hypothetical protein
MNSIIHISTTIIETRKKKKHMFHLLKQASKQANKQAKTSHPITLYLGKISLKNEGKIKAF